MDAADTVDQSEPTQKKKRAKRSEEKETPIATATRRWASEERARKAKNPITESYYELVSGRKLVLCHKTASGTVHKVLVGTTDDKDNGPAIKAQIERLKVEKRIKVRI